MSSFNELSNSALQSKTDLDSRVPSPLNDSLIAMEDFHYTNSSIEPDSFTYYNTICDVDFEDDQDDCVTAPGNDNVGFIELPRSRREFEFHISTAVNNIDELNSYCDLVLSEVNGKLRGLMTPDIVERIRTTFTRRFDRLQPIHVPQMTRKTDHYGPWKKRNDHYNITLSDHSGFKTRRDTTGLNENEYWILPKFKFRGECRKPSVSTYSLSAFRAWLGCERAKLIPSINRKSCFVVASSAAKFLNMSKGELHPKILREALSNSTVRLYDFATKSDKTEKPVNWRISDFIPKPKKFLRFGNSILTPENILEFEPAFKRHKPRFIAALKYLMEDSKIIVPVLQAQLDDVYNLTRPKPLLLGDVEITLANVENVGLTAQNVHLCKRYLSGDKTVNYGVLARTLFRVVHQMDDQPGTNEADFSIEEKADDPPDINIDSFYSPLIAEARAVTHYLPTANTPNDIIAMLFELREYLTEANLLEPASFILLLISLHQQGSWKGVLSTLAGYTLRADVFYWENIVRKLSCLTEPLITYQNDTPTPTTGFWSCIDFVSETGRQLWTALVELCFNVFVPACLPDFKDIVTSGTPFASEMASKIRAEMMKISAKSMAESIISAVLSIVAKIKQCISLRSFAPIFYDVFDPIAWRAEALSVLSYFSEIQTSTDQPVNTKRWNELKEAGFIPAFWTEPFTPHQLNDRINTLVKTGDEFTLVYRADLILLSDVRKIVNGLRALQESNSIGYGVMAQRIQPFGIYISGPAGSGKTNLTDVIFRSIGRANSYSTEPTMKYSWQKGVNFQDSLGYTQWCITLDDIDVNPAPPSAAVESHVDSVIRIINNDPLVVEQSRVEAKGKVASKPLLVMMTSNFQKGRLSSYALQPTQRAFYRRFPLWIEVRAKDEYGSNGVLSSELASESPDGEIYDLKVYKFDPSVTEDFPYTLLDIKTKSDLLQYIIAGYRVHVDRQTLMLSTRSNGQSFCPICFSDWTTSRSCSCKKVLQMKEFFVIPLIGYACYKLYPLISKKSLEISRAVDAVTDTALLASTMMRNASITTRQFEDRLKSFLSPRSLLLYSGITLAALGVMTVILTRMYRALHERTTTTTLQAVVHNAVEGSTPTAWVRAPQEFKPGMPVEYSTYTMDDLIRQLRSHYVTVSTHRGTVYGVVVSNNCVLAPLHVLEELETFSSIPVQSETRIKIIQTKIVHEVIYNAYNVTQVYSDSVIIKVPGLVGFAGMGTKFWYELDQSVSQFDECYLVRESDLLNCTAISSSFMANRIIRHGSPTVLGDCGLCYIARMTKHWKIVSIHNGMHQSLVEGTYYYGIIVTQASIRTAVSRLATTYQMVSIPQLQTGMNYEKQTFSHYPERSEVWTAVSQYSVEVSPIGKADISVHGSTMKSDMRRTIYFEDFEDLEVEWCGRPDYWQAPIFKGEMRNGKWVSPFINSLIPLKRVCHKMDYLWLAMTDMLAGLDQLQTSGYSNISLEQAIIGIPGSVIQATDLKTSAGMPFNQPKTTRICIRDGKAFIEPYLYKVAQEIIDSLESNQIPCPIILCMLKDEAISHKKNLELLARVFNCLPFAFNWVLKTYLAPIECFMRANKGFFGSMVGINMTSLEINEVVRILKNTDPDLSRILALDIKNEDKAEDGTMIDFVSLMLFAISQILTGNGYPIYALVQALKSGVYVIKNDMFQIGGQNPSGQGATVPFNDICTSISLVFFYYRMKYPDGIPIHISEMLVGFQRNFFKVGGIPSPALAAVLTYRDHCSKATYGDDSLQSVAKHCTFYDPNRIPELGLELGFVFTDESKSTDIRYKTIAECSFLKRTFVWRHDLQSYVGVLSLKTLAKMLRWKKRSSLTDRDHAAEQLTNVLRELAYHDKDTYDKFAARFQSTAEKYAIEANAYYRAVSYETYIDQMKSGNFSTWAPITLQMNVHPRIDLKPVIDEAKTVPIEGQVMSSELGWFHSATSSSKSGAPSGPPNASLPKSQLGDFLMRSTKIQSGTLVTTNIFGQEIINFDPWSDFLSSSYIQPKIEAFKYIRSTLEVQISINAPAGAYGLYVLSATPFGDNPFRGQSDFLEPVVQGCASVPHVFLDLTQCSDGKILLPWNHWYDYAALSDNLTPFGYAKMWKLTLYCLQPIATATGTETPAGSFRIWARCLEDHDMVIPYSQMMPTSFDQGRDMVSDMIDETRNSVNAKSVEVVGMKPSGIAGAISTGAGAIAAAVPFLAPLAAPISAVAAGVGAVLSWFGFTRTTEQKTPTILVRRTYSNVANMDCADTSEIAAMSVDNCISYDPKLTSSTHQDEAAFNYLMSKWILIGSKEWLPAQGPQATVLEFPVTPFISQRSSTVGALFTAAGYLGLPFEYWRGDMEYFLYIPMSKFHRGVLQISWSPDPATPIDDITNTRFNHIIDCSTGGNWQFTVGYVSPQPMLYTDLHKFDAPFISSRGANGVVTVSVANSLTSPVETASTRIWVFARACPNMEFGVPRTTIRHTLTDGSLGAVQDFATSFVLQMSGALGDDAFKVQKFNLVPGTSAPIRELCIGERIDSCRGLVQKFSQDYVVQTNVTPGDANAWNRVHFPAFMYDSLSSELYPFTFGNSRNYFTWAGYYSCMFTGIAGGVRYKTVNNTSEPLAAGWNHYASRFGVDHSPVLTNICPTNPISTILIGDAVEINVPYYDNKRFYPTWSFASAIAILNGTADGKIDEFRIFGLVPSDSNVNVTNYIALAPDVRFGMFRFVPTVKSSASEIYDWNQLPIIPSLAKKKVSRIVGSTEPIVDTTGIISE